MIQNQELTSKCIKHSSESPEKISARMEFLYESNPHLSDLSYPDDKSHYYEFINSRYDWILVLKSLR